MQIFKCVNKEQEEIRKKEPTYKYLISRFNFDEANDEELKKQLEAIRVGDLINPQTDRGDINKLFREALEKAALRAKVPQYNRGKRANTEKFERMLKDRTKLHSQLKEESLRNIDRENIEKQIATLNEKILETKQAEEEKEEKKAIEKMKEDSFKAFFRFANRKKKFKETIGPLKSGKEDYTSDPKRMAEILSKQYASVFSIPRKEANLTNMKEFRGERLTDLKLLTAEFEGAMSEIKTGSAPGPDEIPAVVYKKYSEVLAKLLARIWRICLDEGILPEGVAQAIITPIYKGDGKGEAANYRPVALTNHLTKIFERVVRRALVAHMEKHALFNLTQHGFTTGRSTITQLLRYYDSVLSLLEEKGDKKVDTIYLDFSKAFDKVDHGILLLKLEKLGIGGKLLTWLEVFLTKRVQRVRVEGHLSEPETVRSGVPQGSVLGPLLFLIMMLDIDAQIKYCKLGSFADDTRVWYIVRTINAQAQLQQDLEALYRWAEENNFTFNEKKFEHLSHGRSEIETHYKSPNNSEIKQKDLVKDLGVHFSESGNFAEHIEKIVADGKKLSGFVLRTFRTRERFPCSLC